MVNGGKVEQRRQLNEREYQVGGSVKYTWDIACVVNRP